MSVVVKDGDREVTVTPYMMSRFKFAGTQVIKGDQYYIDKAVELGAKAKPKRTKKAEQR